jgi:hypothetical protein
MIGASSNSPRCAPVILVVAKMARGAERSVVIPSLISCSLASMQTRLWIRIFIPEPCISARLDEPLAFRICLKWLKQNAKACRHAEICCRVCPCSCLPPTTHAIEGLTRIQRPPRAQLQLYRIRAYALDYQYLFSRCE